MVRTTPPEQIFADHANTAETKSRTSCGHSTTKPSRLPCNNILNYYFVWNDAIASYDLVDIFNYFHPLYSESSPWVNIKFQQFVRTPILGSRL